jgi:hypothetical protein
MARAGRRDRNGQRLKPAALTPAALTSQEESSLRTHLPTSPLPIRERVRLPVHESRKRVEDPRRIANKP